MSFNLVDAAWIPLRPPSGPTRWVAPPDLIDPALAGHDIEWGRPEFRIATCELLTGLLAAALADRLETPIAWRGLVETPPDREDFAARLGRLRPAFSLDGDGARFLQDMAPLAGEPRAPDALLIDAPGENTTKNGADIFAKRDRFPAFSRKAAAVALYAMQAFAPSGGAGHRTSMRGGGPLTTLVIPEQATLWARLAANLPLLAGAGEQFGESTDPAAVFPWLARTRTSAGGEETVPGHGHYLQAFFGMPRRIRLVFAPNTAGIPCAITGDIDETIVTGFVTEPWGTNYSLWRHPLSPYYRAKTGSVPLPVHAQSGRVGYRDWAAYLYRASANEDLRARQVVDFAQTFPEQKSARLLAAGFVTDNMKCLDWAESEAPLLLLENIDAQDRLAAFAHGRLVAAAETAASALRGALRRAFDSEAKSLIESTRDQFWIETEARFFPLLQTAWDRLRTIGADAPVRAVDTVELTDLTTSWRKVLTAVALRLFDEAAEPDRLGDRDTVRARHIIDARRDLVEALGGHDAAGKRFFDALGLPIPAASKPAGRKKPAAAGTGGAR